jgi:hypothetical protein
MAYYFFFIIPLSRMLMSAVYISYVHCSGRIVGHVLIALRLRQLFSPQRLLALTTPSSSITKDFKLRLNLLLNIYYLDHIFAMASTVELASSFIEGAPPGEVCTSTMIQEPHSLGHRPL